MDYKLNFWIRLMLPLALALFLGTLIYMLAQFREPPGFSWYILMWFTGSIMLIWELGWLISRKLDQRFPWRAGTGRRLALQLFLTNLFGILFFLSSFVILNSYENYVLGHDNPLGLLHILVTAAEAFFIIQIINSAQISYLLLYNWQQVQLEAEALKKDQVVNRLEVVRKQLNPQLLSNKFITLEPLLKEAPEQALRYLQELSINFAEEQSLLNERLAEMQQKLREKTTKKDQSAELRKQESPNYKSRFLVKSGTRFILVSTVDIVAFYKDELVFLYTKDSKKYVLDYSLEELSSLLDPAFFFRINRQHIIHLKYLGEMRSEGQQFSLGLNVPFPGKLVVSQRNVAAFKAWLKEE